MVKILFYRDFNGAVPLLDWLDVIPEKALVKLRNRLDRLSELGHALRRPEADYLRDGIYELRARHLRVNYRILYFFHGADVVVISHGLTKEAEVPSKEIALAIERMRTFRSNPAKHSAKG